MTGFSKVKPYIDLDKIECLDHGMINLIFRIDSYSLKEAIYKAAIIYANPQEARAITTLAMEIIKIRNDVDN